MRAAVRDLLSVVIVAAALLSAAPAAGDTSAPESRSRVLYAEAQAAFARGKFDEALARYAEAYALTPLPGFLYNIGQCHRYAGRFKQALTYYRRYLATGSTTPSRADVEKIIAHLEQRLAPKPASVPTSQPASSLPIQPTQPAEPEPEPEPEPGPEPDRTPSPPTRDGPPGSTVLLWSGVGLASAALITALITGQLASDRSAEYEVATSRDKRLELKSSGEDLARASVVSFVLAGVAGTATALYWWLGYQKGPATVAVLPLEAGGMIAIGGEL